VRVPNTMIATMVETAQQLSVLEDALARCDRRRTDEVRVAYDRLLALERDASDGPITPKNHVLWLDGMTRGVGVHVVSRDHLDRVLCDVATCASATDVVDDTIDVDDFDPTCHLVVLTQPSVVSYLADPIVSPAIAFGANAMAVAPTMKCSVLWWHA